MNGSVKVDLSATSNDSGATFVWSLSNQPDASTLDNNSIGDADKASASFVPDVVGTYHFEVEATSGGKSVSDTTQVTVDNVWQPLTDSSFSAGSAGYSSFAIAPDGTPYVAYRDGSKSNKATVRKFNGTNWERMGVAGFSRGAAVDLSLVVAPDGTLYVAYGDRGNSDKATVKQFDGNGWVDISIGGISAAAAYDTTLAVAPNGRLYVAYADNNKNRKLTVKAFYRSAWAWVDVGDIGFSAGQARSPSLKIAADGTPYVAYQDGGNGDKATVKKFVGGHFAIPPVTKGPGRLPVKEFVPGQWDTVGSAGFSEGEAGETSLTIAPDGTLFVSYKDGANNNKAAVLEFAGRQWLRISSDSLSNNPVSTTTLDIGIDGSPYVAYPDDGKLTVKTYTGNKWELIGSAEFTASGAGNPALAQGPDGTPYIAYTDASSGDAGRVERLTTLSPQITRIQPGKNARRVAGDSDISVRFDRPMAENTLTNSSHFKVTDEDGGVTAESMVYNPATHTETFDPKIELSGDVLVKLTNGVADYAGNTINSIDWGLRVPSWQTVGLAGFSSGEIKLGSSALAQALAPDGTPYVAYTDVKNGDKATVMRFDGNDWVVVGTPGFSDDRAFAISLAIAPSGLPYVLFKDLGAGSVSSATVMRFDDNKWEVVGYRGFSAGRNEQNSLAFAPDGTPYVAYQDGEESYTNGSKGKATVKRYSSNNNSWSLVGSEGFSAGQATSPSLKIAPDGTPYIAYKDDGNSGRATVMRYDSDSYQWLLVGAPGFSEGDAFYPSLALGADGTPYVAYRDAGNGMRATVVQYKNNSWQNVGNPGFSGNKASSTSLALAPDGTPYVAYKDGDSAATVALSRYNGTAWEIVGEPGAQLNYQRTPIILTIAAEGTPYVAFSAKDKGNKAMVIKHQ